MPRSAEELRRDALAIWLAGVDAVRSERLVRAAVRPSAEGLCIGDETIPIGPGGRLAVVGAGKAGAGMALALEEVLGEEALARWAVSGWVNVPADCLRPTARIHLHPARPAGVNEPTAEAAAGVAEIERIVAALGPQDVCLALLSGGGSALLPAPVEGITLDDKRSVTRHLSAAGATIEQLNTVRKQLSRIKGGGLARACRAGRLIALIISDVLGDPLDTIASGPTVEDTSTPAEALAILQRFDPQQTLPASVRRHLSQAPPRRGRGVCRVSNLLIGNNAAAVDAAGMEAERRGYSAAMISAPRSEGTAEEVGRHLAAMATGMLRGGPDALVSGGEPVVRLVEAAKRGKGGRNQQLVLAAVMALPPAAGIVVLAGGTDGEDGPTDAAGAIADQRTMPAAEAAGLDPADFLARNDAYNFFEPLGGLIKTGPTHTNVCDLRVVLVDRQTAKSQENVR